jgi:hypothetical protein
MIRIGSVGEPAHDVRADMARPSLPWPRVAADVGSAAPAEA